MAGSQVWSKHSLQNFANGLVRVEADPASGNKLDNGSNGKLSSCFNPSKPLSIDRYSSEQADSTAYQNIATPCLAQHTLCL